MRCGDSILKAARAAKRGQVVDCLREEQERQKTESAALVCTVSLWASLLASRCERFHARRHLRCDSRPVSFARIVNVSPVHTSHNESPVTPTRPETPGYPRLGDVQELPTQKNAVISRCCPQASADHTSRPQLKEQETSKSFAGGGRGECGGVDQRTGMWHSILSGPGPRLQYGGTFV